MSLDRFADMLKFGINLKLSGSNEDRYYAQRLRFYIMELEDFDCETENDEDLSVYFSHECVLSVSVRDSVLSFEPREGDSYEAIMVVLGFISQYHDIVQEDYKKEQIVDEEVLRKVPLPIEEEDSDDDDFEWI
jgi:hypothetical protein